MSENTIQQWLAQARAAGLPDVQIAAQLKQQGWDDGQIFQLTGYSSLRPAPGGSQPMSGTGATYAVASKHKRLGILFICLPFAVLVLTLIAWAVVIFLAQQADISNSTINIIQWLLGLIGLLAVLGIFVFVPLGIIFLVQKSPVITEGYDERSGKGSLSVLPSEISGWNWGASMLTWIWGIYYNVWISLLTMVPIVNIFWWIVLGIKGNEWAWQAKQWPSVEKFKESQKKWVPWAIVFLALQALGVLVVIFAIIVSISSVRNY